MKMEKLGFQAEVSRLLDIVAHSLYSDRAVFLRELTLAAAADSPPFTLDYWRLNISARRPS